MEFDQLPLPKSSAPIEADSTPLPKKTGPTKPESKETGNPRAGRAVKRWREKRAGAERTFATLSFKVDRGPTFEGWPKHGRAESHSTLTFETDQILNGYQCNVLFDGDIGVDRLEMGYTYAFDDEKKR